jgi:hypothetical protein
MHKHRYSFRAARVYVSTVLYKAAPKHQEPKIPYIKDLLFTAYYCVDYMAFYHSSLQALPVKYSMSVLLKSKSTMQEGLSLLMNDSMAEISCVTRKYTAAVQNKIPLRIPPPLIT